MTEKQKSILESALDLFAKEGFAATSTSRIAKNAGVSEGLIFRHFKNKEGLLQAIKELGSEQIESTMKQLFSIENPEDIIRSVIKMPFSVGEEHYNFWRLMYALKWQTDIYDASMSAPIKDLLIKSFTQLEYNDPIAEAEGILLLMDGIATAVLLRRPNNIERIEKVLLEKYKL